MKKAGAKFRYSKISTVHKCVERVVWKELCENLNDINLYKEIIDGKFSSYVPAISKFFTVEACVTFINRDLKHCLQLLLRRYWSGSTRDDIPSVLFTVGGNG